MKSVGELKPEPSTTCWTLRYSGRGILTVTLLSRTVASLARDRPRALEGRAAPTTRALQSHSECTPRRVFEHYSASSNELTRCRGRSCVGSSTLPAEWQPLPAPESP